MAIRIELWTDGRLVGGAEAWWDAVAAALFDQTGTYPLLNRVDPYDDVSFARDELASLAAELRAFIRDCPEGLRPLVAKLAELCSSGLEARDAQLRFLGD